MQTIGQERAKHAFNSWNSLENQDIKDKYKSYVKRTPVMIMNNGLGQTLAFFTQKMSSSNQNENKAYKALYDHINDWVMSSIPIELFDKSKENNQSYTDLLKLIINKDSTTLRYATMEVMKYIEWLKKFV